MFLDQVVFKSPRGFSLLEIILSLLILSGCITALIGGFNQADNVFSFARFEFEASMLAEREIELLKTELLMGRRKVADVINESDGRFRVPGGFRTRLSWEPTETEGLLKLGCTITRGSSELVIESFLFGPGLRKPNEG